MNIQKNTFIIKNLIDLLIIKTHIVYQYYNNAKTIFYSEDSVKNTSYDFQDMTTYYIITVKLMDDDKVIFSYQYYVGLNTIKDVIIPNDEFIYPDWIIYSDSTKPAKINQKIVMANYYSLEFLSIHYSTYLRQNNVQITLIDHDVFTLYYTITYTITNDDQNYKLVPNISDDTKEFNLFYHPIYNKGDNIYGYKYTSSNIISFCHDDYRIRKNKQY
jgi:hypothetical protein